MARVGILVEELVEESEVREPLTRLEEAGHEVLLIGLERGKRVRGRNNQETFLVERAIDDVVARDFDALVIPGGYAPDALRTDPRMVDLVRDIFDAGKPMAVIDRGGWLLADADIAAGLTVTSWPSIRTDLVNAGAEWVDDELIEDAHVITARAPADLPVFCDALLGALRAAELEHHAHPSSALLDEGVPGEALEQERWHGGEGEGSPQTRDLGGLQQRERLAPGREAKPLGDNEPYEDASLRSSARSPTETGPNEPARDPLTLDADVEAGATTGPHSEERITIADVEARQRERAARARAPEAARRSARRASAEEEQLDQQQEPDTLDDLEGAP